jgi:hypothetical protein
MRTRGLGAGVVLLLAAALVAADVESGPKAGEKVGPLKVFAVTGPVEGKEVNYAAERKDAPTVYLFVNAEKFSRPMARFLKTLDGKLGDVSDDAEAVAVWVGGDAGKNKEYLPRAQTSLKFDKTALTAFAGGAGGPNGWGVNNDAHLTVVLANKGKVVKSFAFVSVNATDVRPVLAAFRKAVGK